MNFNLAKAAEYTQSVVKSESIIGTGMAQLLDYCETNSPNPIWSEIRRLDFERDRTNLKYWLEKILSAEPPAQDINAFWFGLFNPVLDNGKTSCDFYVSGSTTFDPEDETGDWAAWSDDTYLPEGKYANSSVLRDVYHLVAKNAVANIGEYVLCLGYSCFAVKLLCRDLNLELLLGERESRAVVVGFDSGDFIILDNIEKRN